MPKSNPLSELGVEGFIEWGKRLEEEDPEKKGLPDLSDPSGENSARAKTIETPIDQKTGKRVDRQGRPFNPDERITSKREQRDEGELE